MDNLGKNSKENQSPGEKSPQELDRSEFIRQQVKKRPVNKKRMLRRIGMTVLMAAIFGAVACVAFVLLEPQVSRTVQPDNSSGTATVSEEAVTEEITPEEMVENEENTEQARQDEINNAIEEFMKSSSAGKEEYASIYSSLKQYVEEESSCLVDVAGISVNDNWISEEFEDTNHAAGVVTSVNNAHILIAVGYDFSGSDRIRVTFHNDAEAKASILGVNSSVGISVLSVDPSDLTEVERDGITQADFGTVFSNATGNPVIALGRPGGTDGSVNYGIISGIKKYNDIADSAYTLIETDIYAGQDASGVLMDLNGHVIGITKMSFNDSNHTNILSAIGVSELETVIDDLATGQPKAYLGITGTDVTSEISEQENIPQGVYVMSALPDSPAVSAGIQNGDVIIQWGLDTITRYAQLIDHLENSSEGSRVRITYMRYYNSEWQEMETTVTLE